MHELSIARAIVETASRHAEGRRVLLVELKLGALRQVVDESLVYMFGIAARDTLCEGARLEVEPVSALLRCRSCGEGWDPAPAPAADEGELAAPPRFRCPVCAEAGAEVLAGDELIVDSIDVEDDEGDPPPPDPAPLETGA